MNRIARTTLTATIFALTFGTSTLTAQELDGRVQRNPDDTVTYTIDLDGPPRGTGAVFFSLNLLPMPIGIPSFGNLYLAPIAMFPLVNVPLDASGKGQFRVKVPMNVAPSMPLYFQALMNDRGILRLTQNWLSLTHIEAPVDDSLTIALAHNSKTQTYKGEFHGRAGKTVEIVHYRGSQMDIWRGKIPANGVLPVQFQYRNALQHRDVIEIRYGGKQFRKWTR